MSRRHHRDPDLDELFEQDPALRDLARLMSARPASHVRPDPAFRSELRRRLMQEAWTRQGRRPSLWSSLFAPPRLAWAGAAVGTALIALATILMLHGQGKDQVVLPPTSPLDNAQQVSVVKPIELDFNQPMDHQSVEKAVQVEPAIPVRYDWKGNSLLITPVTGTLAPNTQYQVTLAPSAASARNVPVNTATVITFVTQPTPGPTPSVAPSASPALVVNEKALAAIGSLPAQWSADGTTLYFVAPDGSLQSVPAGGGDAKTLAPGVKLFTLGPGGPVIQQAAGIASLAPNGTFGLTVPGASPVGLGVAQGKPEYVEAKTAHTATGAVPLADAATAAWFSPAGDRLVYQAASGLHLIELGSGRDSVVGGATGFLTWAPDGRRFAYLGGDGVYAAADAAATPLKLSTQAAKAATWSLHDEILLSAPGSLSLVTADGGNPRQLAAAEYGQPAWAPAGGTFAFTRAGQVYRAMVPSAQSGLAPTVDETLKVVDGFEKARLAGALDQMGSYLDDSGRASLPDSALKPLRYFVVLAQPGQATVRLLLGDKHESSAVDQTLYLVRAPGAGLLIHKVVSATPRQLGNGPSLLSVRVTGNQLQLEFDSFLDPGSGQGVLLKDAAGKPLSVQPSAHDRVVTVAVPDGLDTGAPYQLVIDGALKDVKGAAFVGEEDIPVLGP